MILGRESTRVYFADEILRSLAQERVSFGVAPDEAQRSTRGHPCQVVPDEDLTVTISSCTDTNSRNGQDLRNTPRNFLRNGLQNQAKAAGFLQAACSSEQTLGSLAGLTLDDPREVEGRLRREAQVSDDRRAHLY